MVSMAETVVDKLVGKLVVREGRGRYERDRVSAERPKKIREVFVGKYTAKNARKLE